MTSSMSNNPDFDTSILNIADDFYDAYLRCLEGKNPSVDEFNRTRYETANVPAIVNGAFAIELYIKSRLDKKTEGHNLRLLFNKLDKELKDSIRNEIESKIDNRLTSFNKLFKTVANAFEYWRYIHEKKDLGYGLNITLNNLSIVIETIRKFLR